MNKWKFFTLDEMLRSDTAQQARIENKPADDAVYDNLDRFVSEVLDPIRQIWGAPLIVSSGFRTPQLNSLVGGSPSSYHMLGLAADIVCHPTINYTRQQANFQLYRLIRACDDLPIDQVIAEKASAGGCEWVHIQTNKDGKQPRHMCFLS